MPRLINPDRWPYALAAYILAGAILGALLPTLQTTAARIGLRAGLGAFACVNLFMPLVAVAVAFAYPRFWTAWLGAILMSASLILARLCVANPNPLTWTLPFLAKSIHPILVVAWLGYALVGTGTVAVASNWRKVDRPDPARHCECGYPLHALTRPRCPECGTTLDARRVAQSLPPDASS